MCPLLLRGRSTQLNLMGIRSDDVINRGKNNEMRHIVLGMLQNRMKTFHGIFKPEFAHAQCLFDQIIPKLDFSDGIAAVLIGT